uniref:Phospholipid/glycerol acyltransferase domain-containing protein n=1 Tax=Acrobeloides nanus TaxID=290746 RepID=A0A914DT83_9BILA
MEHIFLIASLIIPSVAVIVGVNILFAGFGKKSGLRERYVDLLIKIFEWCAKQIQESSELENRRESDENEEIESDDEGIQVDDSNDDSDENSSVVRKTSKCFALKSSKRCRLVSENHTIISRQATLHPTEKDEFTMTTFVKTQGGAAVMDSLYYLKSGIEAIVEDDVTNRFKAEQLASWNMMTRTSTQFYKFLSWKLTLVWILGLIFRYAILIPIRFIIFFIGGGLLVWSTALIGLIPEGKVKRFLNQRCMLASFRILTRSVSAVVYFHDKQNKAQSGGICVANHTSPLDVMILSMDNVYAMVGQRQGGVLGFVQRTLSQAADHIWFERSVANDRSLVLKALKEHVDDPNKLPIIIFPEGTCINNTSVMQFKKGSFEVGAKVYPIAMKYDSRFGNAFWNSSEQSYGEYFFHLMTSWATVCHPDENAIEFANRVKKAIAAKGGLVDLEWDGQLKRYKVPPKLVAMEQDKCYHHLEKYPVRPQGAQQIDEESDQEEQR